MEIHALFAMATSNSSLLSFDDILFKILFREGNIREGEHSTFQRKPGHMEISIPERGGILTSHSFSSHG